MQLDKKQKHVFDEICQKWEITDEQSNKIWDNIKDLEFTSPKGEDVFNAFKIGKNDEIISPQDIRVLILGQDPYTNGKATGLAFLLNQKVTENDSLYYILKAINGNQNIDKTQLQDPDQEKILEWVAKNNVLLLNTALTYTDYKSKSEHQSAWKPFIQQIISNLLIKEGNLVVFLWGDDAQLTFIKCLNNIEIKRNIKIFTCYHPSPRNEKNTERDQKLLFTNVAPEQFKLCNKFLTDNGEEEEINWQKLLNIYKN